MSQQDTSVMSDTVKNGELSERGENANRLAVTGGILGALAASSCCLLPLALTLLGVSGAWMANLRALEAFQLYFIGFGVLALGYGFYQVYWKPKVACEVDDACAKPLNNTLVKSGLWLGTLLMLIAVTFTFWFPLIVPYLP